MLIQQPVSVKIILLLFRWNNNIYFNGSYLHEVSMWTKTSLQVMMGPIEKTSSHVCYLILSTCLNRAFIDLTSSAFALLEKRHFAWEGFLRCVRPSNHLSQEKLMIISSTVCIHSQKQSLLISFKSLLVFKVQWIAVELCNNRRTLSRLFAYQEGDFFSLF